MGNFAQFAAQKAAPAADKVAGTTTPEPKTAPARAIVTGTQGAAPAKPAPAASAALRKEESDEYYAAEADKAAAKYADAEEQDVAFYRKKLDDVARLRREGVIGPTDAPDVAFDVAPMFRGASGRTVSDKVPYTFAPQPGRPEVSLYPKVGSVYTPDDDTLAKVSAFRDKARQLGKDYISAMKDVAAGEERLKATTLDKDFDRRTLPELARQQRALTQKLAERRASMREMGFLDDTEAYDKFK